MKQAGAEVRENGHSERQELKLSSCDGSIPESQALGLPREKSDFHGKWVVLPSETY